MFQKFLRNGTKVQKISHFLDERHLFIQGHCRLVGGGNLCSILRSRFPMGNLEGFLRVLYMGVSQNSGFSSKSSILVGISTINHPFWGTIIFGNTHMVLLVGSYRDTPLATPRGKTAQIDGKKWVYRCKLILGESGVPLLFLTEKLEVDFS